MSQWRRAIGADAGSALAADRCGSLIGRLVFPRRCAIEKVAALSTRTRLVIETMSNVEVVESRNQKWLVAADTHCRVRSRRGQGGRVGANIVSKSLETSSVGLQGRREACC